MDFLHEHHAGLIGKVLQLEGFMEEVISREDDSDKPPVDEATLQNAFAEMEIAADEMDCDRLEELIRELSAYSIPEEEKEHFRKIKRAVDAFDYDAVMEALLERG